MKVIFLDVDGVLNCQSTKDKIGYYVGIDNSKVELLKQIVDATGAEIVVSSTWRLGKNKNGRHDKFWELLTERLELYGMKSYDVTPAFIGEQRGREINTWLEQHPDVTDWVVLDDEWFRDFNAYDIPPHLVITFFYDDHGGLQQEHVEEAIMILNGEFDYGNKLLFNNKEQGSCT